MGNTCRLYLRYMILCGGFHMRTISEVVKEYKHICWYPSAGSDFRALLFLSDWYYKKHNVPLETGQVLPDLFILTDLLGLQDIFQPKDIERYDKLGHTSFRSCEQGSKILHATYMGRYTDITLTSIEELESYNFTFNPIMTSFRPSSTYNSAFLLEVEVETKKYEVVNRYSANVLYVSVQNEFFIKEFLIPSKTKVEYQVLVRYGRDSAIPRSEELPPKIIRAYRDLGIRYLISNEEYVLDAFPKNTIYKPVYSISGGQWSGYGAVNWYALTK